jgi:hypothetical protein
MGRSWRSTSDHFTLIAEATSGWARPIRQHPPGGRLSGRTVDRLRSAERIPRGCCPVPGLSWARRSRPPIARGLTHEPSAAGISTPVHLRPVASCSWLGWVHYRVMWLLGRPSPAWGHARSGRDRRGWAPARLAVVATLSPWSVLESGVDQRNRDLSCIAAAGVPFLLIMDPDPDPDLCVGPAPGSGLAVIIRGGAGAWRVGTTASRVGTRQRRSRRERACPQVGDGRPSNPRGR